MSRHTRISPADYPQHVLNRANDRKPLFLDSVDYFGFLARMRDTAEQVPIDLYAYSLMPTHFHFVVRVEKGEDLSEYMRLLLGAHVRQHHRRHGTIGRGHLYQGRFKNFIIGDQRRLTTVLRYVEANALRAGLVKRAEDWPWCSASHLAAHPDRPHLADWPFPKPQNWLEFVNGAIDGEELQRVRTSIRRGRPYAAPDWLENNPLASRLQHTLNPVHRPRRTQKHVKIE